MKPPPSAKIEYEKVPTNALVDGQIDEILYDENHLFKGKKGSPDQTRPAVRFVFLIQGMKFAKKTNWLKFSYFSEAPLMKNYLKYLVEGANEKMDFDLDQLRGLKVKMLWVDNGEYQNIASIMPADGKKVVPLNVDRAA